MPIYEFKCASCGNKFEELCSSSVRPEELSCPSCGGHDISRCFSRFGFSSGSSGPSLGSASSSSPGGGGCSTCSTRNCSTCH